MTDLELADEIERRRDSDAREYAQLALSYSQWQQIIAALRRGPVPLKLLASAAGFALIPTSVLSNLQTLEDWHSMTGDAFRAKYGREYDEEQILSLFREAHDSINAERPSSGELLMLEKLLQASENMRHGGYRDALVAAYDGWAHEARALLSASEAEGRKS